MKYYFIYFSVVSLMYIKCDPSLRIIKNIDNNFVPVHSSIVEEVYGTKFTLLCELLSTEGNTYFDNQISWIKQSNQSRPPDEVASNFSSDAILFPHVSYNDVNKAVKKFDPLRTEDEGKYICVSLKYALFETVEVIVIVDKSNDEDWQVHRTIYCNDHMFRCVTDGLCIHERYVCDGKPDCKDGSDEQADTCNGDACKDKLKCEDGRCIPTAWCCDKHLDPNCSVTIRPSCCQLLSDTYGEMEYHYVPSVKNTQQGGARYLFISICSLSIVFSMALFLLLLTKIVIFAKKTSLQQHEENQCRIENIDLQNQSELMRGCQTVYSPCNVYPYRISRTPRSERNVIDDCAITDPLFPERLGETFLDDPPSYSDIIETQRLTVKSTEPPPPYTSREELNRGE